MDLDESSRLGTTRIDSKRDVEKALVLVGKNNQLGKRENVPTRRRKLNQKLTNQFFTISLVEYVCNLMNPKSRESAQMQFQGRYSFYFYFAFYSQSWLHLGISNETIIFSITKHLFI
jgi:hypothetical protein